MKMRSAFIELLHEDGRAEIKEPKATFFIFLSGTHPNSHTMNIYCSWLLLTERHSVCHVQLHNSTAHLLYKYCTICTVCNWTVLTVITHNSTSNLPYKYCKNCTVCNRTVLQYLHTSCHYMFGRTTAQHIYCTNTVQTVQSATEMYLQ